MGIEGYFNYCPETGIVTWSADAKGARCKAGAPVGTKDKNGYLTVKVCGTTWKVHRLIFLLMGVPIPTTVDHINGVPDDNRWVNLRGCSPLGNAHNRKVHRNNTTGYKGVTLDRGVIRAQITVKGKHFSKGGFSTLDAASEWYNQMAATHHGEFARSV
ncbi:putative HNH endonuclease [Dickeya phage BF25/12]|uniref:Putative HNH endonuclease n=1 Tax=Dickeya phage BF25/12 TaxID=1698708 RepID=A0A219MH57_9CAUD|nr:putative HNH endonuclease [Dickeya phage BF25/12]ALA46476.1 putative HNH endonuclease [Dickeya phage BF25/12]